MLVQNIINDVHILSIRELELSSTSWEAFPFLTHSLDSSSVHFSNIVCCVITTSKLPTCYSSTLLFDVEIGYQVPQIPDHG